MESMNRCETHHEMGWEYRYTSRRGDSSVNRNEGVHHTEKEEFNSLPFGEIHCLELSRVNKIAKLAVGEEFYK